MALENIVVGDMVIYKTVTPQDAYTATAYIMRSQLAARYYRNRQTLKLVLAAPAVEAKQFFTLTRDRDGLPKTAHVNRKAFRRAHYRTPFGWV